MQIPETPTRVEDLDLMKRLGLYAEGHATWMPDGTQPGQAARQACRELHTHLVELVNKVFAPIMDKIGSREMEVFTMHDRMHGLKVAHLMWHILKGERQERLTPPEIGILVVAAHLHDLGMGLSTEERQQRLAPESDLWARLELDEQARAPLDDLRRKLADPRLQGPARVRAEQQLFQAEEALLCQDTRERHASRERYSELIRRLRDYHNQDPANIPDADCCLSFQGDSFLKDLIEVCLSHNEQAESLLGRSPANPAYLRFASDSPFGSCVADLKVVGAALRLADILDFDRERTPPALFQYLFPGPLAPEENRSVLEWSKHLAISHWRIEPNAVVFRGRCSDHIIHHAVVQFCAAIEKEIAETKLAFETAGAPEWPFCLPSFVKADIAAQGYVYVPYRFELDDERIYALLMGGAIYDNPLVAVRELIQNAVDACTLRDRLRQLAEPGIQLPVANRIVVGYEEPSAGCPQPRLSVRDTGTGMDEYILRTYFLRVGQSYYRSTDFLKHRVELCKQNLDFAPVSEFGIGFLSCFLLADRVKVETAMAESWRTDTRKRTLLIDGPTRLIRLIEEPNEGPTPWKGTQVTLHLARGSRPVKAAPPSWGEIKQYIKRVCQELPYHLHLRGASGEEVIVPGGPKTVDLPPEMEKFAFRIPIDDRQAGIEGEVILINRHRQWREESKRLKGVAAVAERSRRDLEEALLRGGFLLAEQVPGVPHECAARIRLKSLPGSSMRYISPNLARSQVADAPWLEEKLFAAWFGYLFEKRRELPEGTASVFWLSDYELTAHLAKGEAYDGLGLYELARNGWTADISEQRVLAWETGRARARFQCEYDLPDLHEQILQLILPAVAELELDDKGQVWVAPPVPGWRERLKTLRRFEDSSGWRLYASFVGKHSEWLAARAVGGPVLLNTRYHAKIESAFEKDEIEACIEVIGSVTGGARRVITPEQGEIWERVQREFRGLQVGVLHPKRPATSWPVESLTVAGAGDA